MLVENGLAEISVFGNKAPENIDQLELAEEQAKKVGSGIW
jgi:staphylococcal nuclease domain-containing protein 1